MCVYKSSYTFVAERMAYDEKFYSDREEQKYVHKHREKKTLDPTN